MRTILSIALVAAVAGSGLLAWAARPSVEARRIAPASKSSLPSVKLLVARPFQLAQPEKHVWRREQPSYDAGWLLVLETDGGFCEPTQFDHVLYAADTTVERVNYGSPSGRIVAILPSARGANGEPILDLRAASFWWGEPALPEEIDAGDMARAIARARSQGIAPRPLDEVARALSLGGESTIAQDHGELLRIAAELVLVWAPGEEELANSILAPLLR